MNEKDFIEVTDIDVVAYAKMKGRTIIPAGLNNNSKIFFKVELTQAERADYYNSDLRKFKETIDLVKKTYLDKRNQRGN